MKERFKKICLTKSLKKKIKTKIYKHCNMH